MCERPGGSAPATSLETSLTALAGAARPGGGSGPIVIGWLRRVGALAIDHPIATSALVAAVARAATIAVVATADLLPRIAVDAYYFTDLADAWASGDLEVGSLEALSFQQLRGFVIPLGLLLKVTGSQVVAAQVWSAVLGVVAVVLVSALLARTAGNRWALVGGLVAALFPSQVLWSSVGIRESTVWAATAGIALFVAWAWRASGARLLVAAVGIAALLVLLANLRMASFVVATWALILAAAMSPGRSWRMARFGGALALGVVIPAWLAGGPLGWQVVRNHENLSGERVFNAVGAETALVDTWRPTPERAETLGVDPGASLDVPDTPPDTEPVNDPGAVRGSPPPEPSKIEAPTPTLDAVADEGLLEQLGYLPRGLSVMLLEPYPWTSLSGANVRLAQIENLASYPLLGLAAIGGLMMIRQRQAVLAFPALVGGGLLVAYALSEGNFGTAYRHRGEVVWIVIVLATLGLRHLARRRNLVPFMPSARTGALQTHPQPDNSNVTEAADSWRSKSSGQVAL